MEQEWKRILGCTKIKKEDMNYVVMNYLVVKGYKEVAEAFQFESGTQDSIERRSNISKLIQTGDTENALEIVRLLDPKLLKEDKHLFFQLHKQILLDFISHGEAIQALQYARTELADFIVENPQYTKELEEVVALVAFEDPLQTPLGHLVTLSQRKRTAEIVDEAILTHQHQSTDPLLCTLLRTLCLMESELSDKIPPFDIQKSILN